MERTEGNCAVYALNLDWLHDAFESKYPELSSILKEDPNVTYKETFKKLFGLNKPSQFVASVNAFELNERLAIQQGIYLCPSDVSAPFEDNLTAFPPKGKFKGNFIKIQIKTNLDQKNDILRRLHRMNMNRATLFPDLDGFAQSLKTLLVLPEILEPFPDWIKQD